MEALKKASLVYTALHEAVFLSGNRSIAEKTDKQMRPDLILLSQNANYILVELKGHASEREAVQELLAYSAAIRMQFPYVHEFMFVIVAADWGTLLSYSVRAMIMDNKYVLPLEVTLSGDARKYCLSVKTALFDNFRPSWYDPYEAMSVHSYATTFYQDDKPADPSGRNTRRAENLTRAYLMRMADRINAECLRLRQTGFVFVYEEEDREFNQSVFGITVATVNQNWRYNERTYHNLNGHKTRGGIAALKEKIANQRRKEIFARQRMAYFTLLDEDGIDIFLKAEASQAKAELFRQSSLSFDLLMGAVNTLSEREIKATGSVQSFESGGYPDLGSLVREIVSGRQFLMPYALYFGELKHILNISGDVDGDHLSLLDKIQKIRKYKLDEI